MTHFLTGDLVTQGILLQNCFDFYKDGFRFNNVYVFLICLSYPTVYRYGIEKIW